MDLDLNATPPAPAGGKRRLPGKRRVRSVLNRHIEDLVALSGRPYTSGLKRIGKQTRCQQHGSLAVEVAGEKQGAWYDHENNRGGYGWEFVRDELGIPESEIIHWTIARWPHEFERQRKRKTNGTATTAAPASTIEATAEPPPASTEDPEAEQPPKPANGGTQREQRKRIVASYDYDDKTGELLFQVVRFEPKSFSQRRWAGNERWIWNVKGVRKVPYRLPHLLASSRQWPECPVIIVEGEKDVDRLYSLGFPATTNAEGAGKWTPDLNEHFRGLVVYIIPDNDDAGLNHAEQVARNLHGIAASVAIVRLPDLPPKGDVSDFFDAGGTKERLIAFCQAAPKWQSTTNSDTKPRAAKAMNNSGRRMIRATPGDLADIVEEALDALAAETDPMAAVYVRGGILVRPLRLHSRLKACGIRRPMNALSLCWVDRHWLALRLAQIACFYLPLDEGDMKLIDPPDRVCQIILKSSPWDGLPALTGIIEAPTIRPDGSLLTAPGYDPATGLLFDPGDTTFPPIPDAPTRADAEAAVRVLLEPYKAFPFVDEPSRSVALSSILTILVRRMLRAAPLFGYTAPDSSSGKTLLSNVPSYIATGRLPYLVSQARTPEEEEKRVLAALIECPTALTIDNVERPLQSDTLCSIITAPVFTGRVLGLTKTATVETNCMLSATGNNLAVAGDLNTRALFCRIDPKCERPQERHFAVNLDTWVPSHRGELVAAALTIIRAYLVAGEPKPQAPNFGDGFGDWQRFCRFPLLWIGRADPVATRERIEASDPVRQKLRALLAAWHDYFGEDRTSVAAAIKAATSNSPQAGDLLGEKAAVLNQAMKAVASGEKDSINPTRLGKFIGNHEDRIVGGLRFVQDGERGNAAYWKAKKLPADGEAGEAGEVDSANNYARAGNGQANPYDVAREHQWAETTSSPSSASSAEHGRPLPAWLRN